jgi:hypothetical protein
MAIGREPNTTLTDFSGAGFPNSFSVTMGYRLVEGADHGRQEIGLAEELGRIPEPFLSRLGHKARRQMFPVYVSGLVGLGDRRSIQPMAERLAPGNRHWMRMTRCCEPPMDLFHSPAQALRLRWGRRTKPPKLLRSRIPLDHDRGGAAARPALCVARPICGGRLPESPEGVLGWIASTALPFGSVNAEALLFSPHLVSSSHHLV